MNWRERLTPQISSGKIKPKVGMRIIAIKPIDNHEPGLDNIGTIVRLETMVEISWDKATDYTYEDEDNIVNQWNGDMDEWNDGCFKIVKR